ncbi:response regulator transcription factor [Frankia sp. R82]|uniref:response regulator n=1 Tax=Frankia sp. R82 TaxID=2950553 RepID=UPI002042FCC9|nr:response regulator transcription factor [Frankia sp. R82]MCM3883350.1 response regulator transcription factor [Frankia sp. R82]
MPLSVLLVDDQPLLRLGFRMILSSQPGLAVAGEAEDGAEAIRMAAELAPDVVLMDIRMPGIDGIEATRQIIAAGGATKVLILTTFDIDQYAYAALRAGASGFLLKDVRPADLHSAILAVASGDAVVAPSITRRLLDTFAHKLPDPDQPEPSADPRLGRLTERETVVLHEVAAGRSNAEIARHLVLSEATVKTHVGRILAKLELRDRVQAVVFAYETGFVRASDRPSPRPGG